MTAATSLPDGASMKDPLQQTASAVDNLGRAGLATLYGGVRIDEQAGAVDVLLTDLSPVVQAQLAKAVPHPKTLHLIQGRYRLTELEALQHQIDSDWSRLASEGIHISSTGIGFGVVNVTVAESDPNIATVLHARYGDAIVVVLGQAVRTHRDADP